MVPDARTVPAVAATPSTERDPSRLHRDAVAIWQLLDDLDEDEHRLRARLLAARAEVRAAAAAAWRERGWRSIADDR